MSELLRGCTRPLGAGGPDCPEICTPAEEKFRASPEAAEGAALATAELVSGFGGFGRLVPTGSWYRPFGPHPYWAGSSGRAAKVMLLARKRRT